MGIHQNAGRHSPKGEELGTANPKAMADISERLMCAGRDGLKKPRAIRGIPVVADCPAQAIP